LVNVPDSLGRTPLFYAVSFGEGECTKQLLAVGADARLAETLTGMGPLHVAARAGDTALVMNLLEDAASVELQPDALARNVDGDTALVLACRRLNWPCAQELIRAGGVELPVRCFAS
jgi:ankyrin repeat protein